MSTDKPRNAAWDSNPEGYDLLRRNQGWLNIRRANFLRDWLIKQRTTNVFEIGSGTGELARQVAAQLPNLHWQGIDPLPNYVAFAQNKTKKENLDSRVKFLTGTAERLDALPFAGPFDAIISSDVLHHIDDMPATVRAAAKLARAGAMWCAIEPNPYNPYALLNQVRRKNERPFWPKPFIQAAANAGWKLVEQRYLFLIPPFIPNPSDFLKYLESEFENIPCLGGGIVLILQKTS